MFAIVKCPLCGDRKFIHCPLCDKNTLLSKDDSSSEDEESLSYEKYVLKDYENDLALAIKLSLDMKKKCKICFDKEIDSIFLKCGHMYCCYRCAKNCKGKCPICRSEKSKVKRVFSPE